MKHLDANVLIAWHRADHPHHEVVAQWCRDLLDHREPFGATDLVWNAVLRICSNRKVFLTPSPIDALFAFQTSVAAQLGYLSVNPEASVWERMEELCARHNVSANLVTDAYLAAAAMDDGADLVSLDHDFSRFTGLRWIDPRSTTT